MDQSDQKSYHISKVAKFFHELPHLNVKLQRIQNATFDEQNKEYVESLLVFVSIPILVLIIVLLVYLFYSICICLCGTSDKSKKNIDNKGCKVFIFLFALFCGATFIVGLIGSWKIHDGVSTVHNATEDAAKLFNSIKNDTKVLSQTVNVTNEVKTINTSLNAMIPDYGSLTPLIGALNSIMNYTNSASYQLTEVYEKMQSADIDSVPKDVKKYENYRWIFTFVIVAVLAVIGISFICVIFSRCFLIMFTIFAIFALIICVISLSLTFGLNVTASDFCYEAKPYIKSHMNGMVEKTITEYYIECPLNAINPLESNITQAEIQLINATQFINTFKSFYSILCISYPTQCNSVNQTVNSNIDSISSKVNQANAEVKDVRNLVDCRRINEDLNNSLSAVCTDILEGLVMTFANAVSASFAFIVIVFCSTYTAH